MVTKQDVEMLIEEMKKIPRWKVSGNRLLRVVYKDYGEEERWENLTQKKK